MKKLFVFITLFIGLSYSILAGSEFKSITAIEGKAVTLSFDTKTQEVVKVAIKDLNGIVLHQETVNTLWTSEKVYNLKNLPDGEYIIEKDRKMKTISQYFSIENEMIELLREEVLYKPVTSYSGNIWSLNLLTLYKDAFISIKEFNGEQLYVENISAPSSVNKTYSLKNLPKGIYSIGVSIGNEVFTETVAVQ